MPCFHLKLTSSAGSSASTAMHVAKREPFDFVDAPSKKHKEVGKVNFELIAKMEHGQMDFFCSMFYLDQTALHAN